MPRPTQAKPKALSKQPNPKAALPSSNSAPSPSAPSPFDRAIDELRRPTHQFPNVSPRWLLAAAAVVLLAAAALGWFALCLLYWQGSWQLLYHPKTSIQDSPAMRALSPQSIHFAATETGATQLTGWWIPSKQSFAQPAPKSLSPVFLYLHGADGDLADAIPQLTALHSLAIPIFAIDYRGYGQSQRQPALPHPNEKQMRQDVEWALTWLTLTNHIPPSTIVVFGTGLGATLAAQLASDHSELAGVILDQPIQNPMDTVFNDPRSRIVPAHWLVTDRYDLTAATARFQIPSLWIRKQPAPNQPPAILPAYEAVPTIKTEAWLKPPIVSDPNFVPTLERWLDDLHQPSNP